MNKPLRLLVSIAAMAAAPLALMPATAAHADTGQTYTASLNQINNSGGSGMIKVWVNGDQATVTESWSGLAAKFGNGAYPHVQHIHVGAKGSCPTASADKNGDGIVDTVEGAPFYGKIGTTLSTSGSTAASEGTNIKVAPAGSSTSYHRTFTLNSATAQALKNNTAVVVVHGLDPSKLSKKAQGEKSNLVPSLPLAATSPALCGALRLMPVGAPQTGAGTTGGLQDQGLLAGGAGLIAAAGGVWLLRRKTTATKASAE